MSDLPLTYNVERIREAMLSGLLIPREIVNKAFSELDRQIGATRTLYYQKNGKVTDKRVVEDNGARLQAIDQTMSLAGLFKPDDRRGSGGGTPNVSIEVSKEGVIRIAVGSSSNTPLNPAFTPAELSLDRPAAISSIEVAHVQDEVSHKNENIDDLAQRFNTILDEIVEE